MKDIHDNFLCESALYPVPLSAAIGNSLKSKFSDPKSLTPFDVDQNMFDSARDFVFRVMYNDSFQRFSHVEGAPIVDEARSRLITFRCDLDDYNLMFGMFGECA